MFSPILIERSDCKLLITESDLLDYPGMFVNGTATPKLKGLFAPYPMREEVKGGGFRQWVVVQRENYIARVAGTRTFPWRVIGIAERDGDLLLNDLVYRLASPAKQKDWSWIRPGMSTEEWICASNLRSVDFVSGFNTATYKYYIDFASAFGMPYVMLDAGWSENEDLFKITPGLDLRELATYAKSKNVGLILWTLSMTLDKQLEPALDFFSELGIKAVMTDFMDRDDQKMVQFYQRVAEATAHRKIMVFFHGAFKSAGFERTYPHCITREATLGSEYNIWSDKANPDHDLLLPFIRMASGVMDYEPGFYDNATKAQFRPIAEKVMSQGTRTHQLAMFVVYESPLQMFSGNPSDAWKEPEYTQFLTSLPTTWDNTHVFEAALGRHLLIGRQKGNDWYIGAMNNWEPKEYLLPLNFLTEGDYELTICQDGPNAARNALDYQLVKKTVSRNDKLNIHLAPGGGYVGRLVRK
jgi:alpha-glucosidase